MCIDAFLINIFVLLEEGTFLINIFKMLEKMRIKSFFITIFLNESTIIWGP